MGCFCLFVYINLSRNNIVTKRSNTKAPVSRGFAVDFINLYLSSIRLHNIQIIVKIFYNYAGLFHFMANNGSKGG